MDVEPSISPTLTITENLQYSGEGACNTFSGQYSFIYGDLSIDSFIPTTDTCDFQSHTQFENHYFEFFSEGMELQIDFISETELTLNSLFFTSMHFSSSPLGISKTTISEAKIYPNPTSDELFISLEKDKVEKIVISSISGKNVLETINVENQLTYHRL